MARPGITREQVFEAAEALAAEGINPTVIAVRAHLGSGSPNNITRHLSDWRAQRETATVESVPAPPEGFEQAIRQVWAHAWKAAQAQLVGEREALNEARRAIEQERASMLAEIERLDAALEAAQERAMAEAQALETERRAHAQTREALREATVLAEERARQIERMDVERRENQVQLTALSGRIGTLEAENQRANADLELARQRLSEWRAQASQSPGTNGALAKELDSARNHAREARQIADLAGKKVAQLERDIEVERRAREEAERKLEVQERELAELRSRASD
ncbi:DNA-binding protein [Allochromatium vinosum]|uniref:KfrA N-terminal DNA-binding domain-containing protein n=1 Tax=Allochromatium vinosum (strain ATCC 17899 / DSM 180 / NBRC 103801 / NCIMB 10441 / D) TaxID=572477 RepID=D3RWB1_ALLVD|nr:DNA-binding protein [Allochromatium vinosum]ADC64123.1 conserved hypothetical protein [Allochromatium vinosum DSM 180]